ncbi:MAG: hypothetical protein QM750_29845 [Rubrivivax sp.]
MLAAPSSWAGPTAVVEGAGEAAAKPPDLALPAVAGASAATAGIPQSKTVELLLQMQDQAATNKPNGDAATVPRSLPLRGAAAADAAAQPDETPLSSLKSVILNSSLAKPGDAQEAPVQAQRAGLRMDAPAAGDSPKAGESSSSLLNQPVIRFIRENRGLTMVGCAVALAAVWAAATFSSSRRSRSRSR